MTSPLYFSSSFLDKSCPKEAQFYKLDKRVSSENKAARTFGAHLHTALKAKSLGQDPVEALVKAFEAEPISDAFRTLDWANEIMSEYFSRFSDDWEIVRDKSGTPMVEYKFCTPLCVVDGVECFYHGIIDLMIRRNGVLYVLDYKSTSVLGTSYWETQRVISAPRGYAWALQPAFEERIDGYIIRAIRTSTPSQKLRNTGTEAEKRRWWNESFGDELYIFSPGELEEWHAEACSQVREFIRRTRENDFPRRRSCCVSKYGKCDYYEVCNTYPIKDRTNILSSLAFKDKEDNMSKIEE